MAVILFLDEEIFINEGDCYRERGPDVHQTSRDMSHLPGEKPNNSL